MRAVLMLAFAAVFFHLAEANQKRKPSGSEEIVCSHEAPDASLSATFSGFKKGKVSVKLYVSSGDSEGKSYKGECKHSEGAMEASYHCNVATSTDSGYDVSLNSTGGAYSASASPWTMTGPGEEEKLSCKQ